MYGRPRRRGIYGPIEKRPWSERELAERLEAVGIESVPQHRVLVSHEGRKATRRIDLAVGNVGIELINMTSWVDDKDTAERAVEIIEQGYSLVYLKITYNCGQLSPVVLAFIDDHLEAVRNGLDCPYVGISYKGHILEWGRPVDGQLRRYLPAQIGPAPAPQGYRPRLLWEDWFKWHPKD